MSKYSKVADGFGEILFEQRRAVKNLWHHEPHCVQYYDCADIFFLSLSAKTIFKDCITFCISTIVNQK